MKQTLNDGGANGRNSVAGGRLASIGASDALERECLFESKTYATNATDFTFKL
jgi:hypothetical protein